MKTCTKCKIEQEESCFSKDKNKKDGLNPWCKPCVKEYNKEYRINNKEHLSEYNKEYQINNKEHLLEYNKEYRSNNKEQIDERQKEYRVNNKEQLSKKKKEYYQNNKEYLSEYNKEYRLNNKEQIDEKQKEYYQNNKEQIAEYKTEYQKNNKEKRSIETKHKLANNSLFRLRCNISNTINKALKAEGFSKRGQSIMQYLPYKIKDLKLHLEKQFLEKGNEWMTWDNWGVYNRKTWKKDDPSTWTWNIDHRIAQSKLPFTSMEEENFQKCWALDNLRPYSAKQNVIDGNRR